ncbi:hypothetical protein QS26_11470 [Salmonella enterica subsp. enterica serovar Havana]|nr:hypothetical protein QS26_11470 [Salmonella enterica subsp. enterica serovar Havana]VEB49779.1 corB transporter [Salmonella enterica subsp. enterica serovar Havana]
MAGSAGFFKLKKWPTLHRPSDFYFAFATVTIAARMVRPFLAEEVTPQNDGSVIIDGTANVREINKALNWHLPEDDARTVNGVILEALEEIPVAGTRVRIEQYDINILDVQENMIKQVKVVPVKPLRESILEYPSSFLKTAANGLPFSLLIKILFIHLLSSIVTQ